MRLALTRAVVRKNNCRKLLRRAHGVRISAEVKRPHNMKLDSRITTPALLLAKDCPAFRDLTGLVTGLLYSFLHENSRRGKALCKTAGVEWPSDLLS